MLPAPNTAMACFSSIINHIFRIIAYYANPYIITRFGQLYAMSHIIIQSWNKSSSKTWFPIKLLYLFFFTPYVVIIVSCIDFLHEVLIRKRSTIFLRILSYVLSISYSSVENFISHKLTTWSLRSISKSICAPCCIVPFSFSQPLEYQMDSSDNTPDMP